ncbi:hypothetical protein LV75_002377 [Actinokineospora diospyrosa]|uniref:Uncharacterized protein n=1 Tax=Actinokineospora diospyrosa TaxID=103728 RepID=A0ABT1IB71_9PSEU|nr:hypothetical protein [Actinokineospora diospyrosa]
MWHADMAAAPRALVEQLAATGGIWVAGAGTQVAVGYPDRSLIAVARLSSR